MFKKTLILSIIILFTVPAIVFAGGSSNSCATKYPIVLSHGMGAQANNLGIGYWYNIPSALTSEGAKVYISNQVALNSSAYRGAELKTFVLQVLAVTGAAKVNIVAHSQGGLDARYMISNLGMSTKVATLTTMSTPHRGSAVADVIMKLNADTGGWIASIADTVYIWLFGGKQNIMGASILTRPYMANTFNPNTPNKTGVMYQSWTAKIKLITADFLLSQPTWLLLLYYEGANDCLVSTTSGQWGTFRGVLDGAWYAGGVSHFNMCDQFLGITPGFDAPTQYANLVAELKNKGY